MRGVGFVVEVPFQKVRQMYKGGEMKIEWQLGMLSGVFKPYNPSCLESEGV